MFELLAEIILGELAGQLWGVRETFELIITDSGLTYDSLPPSSTSQDKVNWLFDLLQQPLRDQLNNQNSIKFLNTLIEKLHEGLDEFYRLSLSGQVNYIEPSQIPTKVDLCLIVAKVFEQIYYHLPYTASSSNYYNPRARCAWEIAKYYQQAASIRNYQTAWQTESVYWLSRAVEYDEKYAQLKFRNTPRADQIRQMLRSQPKLLEYLEGKRTITTPNDRAELTPPPYHGGSSKEIYDADYTYSHAYHYMFAKHFEKARNWEHNVAAYETAIWLVTRTTYRKEYIKAAKRYAQNTKDERKRQEYAGISVSEQEKLDQDQ